MINPTSALVDCRRQTGIQRLFFFSPYSFFSFFSFNSGVSNSSSSPWLHVKGWLFFTLSGYFMHYFSIVKLHISQDFLLLSQDKIINFSQKIANVKIKNRLKLFIKMAQNIHFFHEKVNLCHNISNYTKKCNFPSLN